MKIAINRTKAYLIVKGKRQRKLKRIFQNFEDYYCRYHTTRNNNKSYNILL